MNKIPLSSSYRDPSGFVYQENGTIYRQINKSYQREYEQLLRTGLFTDLVKRGLLIPHEEIKKKPAKIIYKIIRPQPIPFISYVYEWCFSQLREAALVTLEIHRRALKFGMVLKDASPYNIQFLNGRPVLIDTLSFAIYEPGVPWIAYRQFCETFLSFLALMSQKDLSLGLILRAYIDGIPLITTAKLLPPKTWINFGLLTHIHLHSLSQAYYASREPGVPRQKISYANLIGLTDNLTQTITGMKPHFKNNGWINYYRDFSYSTKAMIDKQKCVSDFLGPGRYRMIWDLGANTGLFSRLAAKKADSVIAFDSSPEATEKNYQINLGKQDDKILPLVMDLTNPSPAVGWANEERMSLAERGPADMALALGLIHHLAIGNNIPFSKIAKFFKKITRKLIIEFVPKKDIQIIKMLNFRKDIFPDYTEKAFEVDFQKHFKILRKKTIADSLRSLYLMETI